MTKSMIDQSFLAEHSEADDRVHLAAAGGMVAIQIDANDGDALAVRLDPSSAKRMAVRLFATALQAETPAENARH